MPVLNSLAEAQRRKGLLVVIRVRLALSVFRKKKRTRLKKSMAEMMTVAGANKTQSV